MKIWMLSIVLIFLTACAPAVPSTGGPEPAAPESLVGTQWQLESFGPADNPAPLVQGSQVTLVFEEGGQAGGNGGCNSYGAQYRAENGVISFQEIVSTLMACAEQQVTDQEAAYFRALEGAERYEWIDEDHLRIHSSLGVLNFVRQTS